MKKLDEWFDIVTYAVLKSIWTHFRKGGYGIIRTMGKYIYEQLEEKVDLEVDDPKEAVRRMVSYAREVGYISDLEVVWKKDSIELIYTGSSVLSSIDKLIDEKCKILPCFFTSAVMEALSRRGIKTEISESIVISEEKIDKDILRVIKI